MPSYALRSIAVGAIVLGCSAQKNSRLGVDFAIVREITRSSGCRVRQSSRAALGYPLLRLRPLP